MQELNSFEKQRIRKDRIRNYIRAYRTNSLNKSPDLEFRFHQIEYFKNYYRIVESLYELLFYHQGFPLMLSMILSDLYHSFDQAIFKPLEITDTKNINYIINIESSYTELLNDRADVFTVLELKNLITFSKEMTYYISKESKILSYSIPFSNSASENTSSDI